MTPTTAEDAVLRLSAATTEIETSEWAAPRELRRPREAAQRHDEHQEAARTPKQCDLKFFVFSVGITAPVHQRRRASAQAAVNRATDRSRRATLKPGVYPMVMTTQSPIMDNDARG